MSGDAAFVLAFFSFGFGLLAASFLSSERTSSQKNHGTDAGNRRLKYFHTCHFLRKGDGTTQTSAPKHFTQTDFTAASPNVYRVFGYNRGIAEQRR